MGKRDAYQYATREVDRVWPAPLPPEPDPPPIEPAPESEPPAVVEVEPPPLVEPAPVAEDPPAVDLQPPAPSSGGGVEGLGDLPEGWPSLPANATLPAEVGWVQANRLLVRRGDGVDLSRSLAPAPSYAALSWLETSILYPSKWADVTVKAAQGQENDSAEDARRERIALAEVHTLLAEASVSATS